MDLFKRRLHELASATIFTGFVVVVCLLLVTLMIKYIPVLFGIIFALAILGVILVALYQFIDWLFIEPYKSRKKK